jgi:hypothetical protein
VILFRFQIDHGNGWSTEWVRSRVEGLKKIEIAKKEGQSAYLDEMELLNDRDSMAEQMNSSDVHRLNWPGKEVARTP